MYDEVYLRIAERVRAVGKWWKARFEKKWYQLDRPSYKEWYTYVFGNYELTVDAMMTMSVNDLMKIHKECIDRKLWIGDEGMDEEDKFYHTAISVLGYAVMSTRDGQDNAVSTRETDEELIQLYEDDIKLIGECLNHFGCPSHWAFNYYGDPKYFISETILRNKYPGTI